MDKTNWEVGNSICDMHYGSMYPFQLPKSLEDKFKVLSAIVVRTNNFSAPDAIDYPTVDFYRWIESVTQRMYMNKELVVVDNSHYVGLGQLVCAFSYDNRHAGFVVLGVVV